MKLIVSTLALLSVTAVASAWKLDLYAGNRHVNFHGTRDSGCKNIAFTPPLNVNRAKFDPKTDWFPDPDTFALYVNTDCRGLSYRNSGGDYELAPRVIRSYKVE